jgi:hypothetical protein
MISTGYTPDDMLRWLSDPDYRADYTVTIPEGPADAMPGCSLAAV